MLSQPAKCTYIDGSPSALPSAKERNPSSCVGPNFEKTDDVRRSHVGRSSESLRMAMSNSVTGASMHGNGTYSEKRTRKTRLWDDFESSTSASSLRIISACDGVSSLAVLCASESQTNIVARRHRERGGESERAGFYSRNNQTNTDGSSMMRPQYMDFTLTNRHSNKQ